MRAFLLSHLFITYVFAHEGHGHGGEDHGSETDATTPWETEGYFQVDGDYTIKFERVNGAYGNDSAIVVVIPLSDCDSEGMEAMESEVQEMWTECVEAFNGETHESGMAGWSVEWELTFHEMDQAKFTEADGVIKEIVAEKAGEEVGHVTLTFEAVGGSHNEAHVKAEIAADDEAAANAMVATLNAITKTDMASDLTAEFTADNVSNPPELEALGTAVAENHDSHDNRRRLIRISRKLLSDDHDSHEGPDDHEAHNHVCHLRHTNEWLVVGTDAHLVTMNNRSWVTTAHFHYDGCVGIFSWPVASEMGIVIASASGVALSFGSTDDHDGEFSSTSSGDTEWGQAIGAVFMCLAPTLMAVFFLGKIREFMDRNLVYILAFALGVILSTAVIHVYPEGMGKLNFTEDFPNGHESEVAKFWASGTAFLAGLVIFLGLRYAIIGGGHSHGGEPDSPRHLSPEDKKHRIIVEDGTEEFGDAGVRAMNVQSTEHPQRANRWNSTTLGILVGDGAHHFVDGVVIGAAFEGCSTSFAWTITFAILIHESAHTLADICIILAQGFTVIETALLNIASGLLSLLGCIIVLSTHVNANVQGLLLIFGSSMFAAVALIDILPQTEALSRRSTFWPSVVFFIIGCVIMGLMLLKHEHCEAEGSGHDDHTNH